jgi:transketolase
MAERHLAARFGDDLVDHRTWVVAGDGCLMEGVAGGDRLAGRYKLNKLTVLWDDNEITIDGKVSLSDTHRPEGALQGRRLGGEGHRRP